MDKAVLVILFCVQVFALIPDEKDNCSNGAFGRDCQLQCHCVGGCEHDFRSCSTNCDEGWTGPTCQKAKLPMKKTANIRNTAASQYPGGYASRAVDGNRDTCIHANATGSTERLRVELSAINRIQTIVIANTQKLSRGDRNWIKNLEIKVGNTTTISKARVCSRYPDKFPESGFVSIPCMETGKYIWFIKKTSPYRFISLCEVEVYGKGCNPHTWGDNCGKFCGQCAGGATCDVVTGKCPGDLCKDGWTGELCNQVIPDPTTMTPSRDDTTPEKLDPIRTTDVAVKATVSPDVCLLEVDNGYECPDGPYFRWDYYYGSGICFPSIYLGCGGNGNRFITRSQCENTCMSPVVTTPEVKITTLNYLPDSTTDKQHTDSVTSETAVTTSSVVIPARSDSSFLVTSDTESSIGYGMSSKQMFSLADFMSDVKPTKSMKPLVSDTFSHNPNTDRIGTTYDSQMSAYVSVGYGDSATYSTSTAPLHTYSPSTAPLHTYSPSTAPLHTYSDFVLDGSLRDSTLEYTYMNRVTVIPLYTSIIAPNEDAKIFTVHDERNEAASSHQMDDRSSIVVLSHDSDYVQTKGVTSFYGTRTPDFIPELLPAISTAMLPNTATTGNAMSSNVHGNEYGYDSSINGQSVRSEPSSTVDQMTDRYTTRVSVVTGVNDHVRSKSTSAQVRHSSTVWSDLVPSKTETTTRLTTSVNIVPTTVYTPPASSVMVPIGKGPDLSSSGKVPGDTNIDPLPSDKEQEDPDSSSSDFDFDVISSTPTAVTRDLREASSSSSIIPIVLAVSFAGLLLSIIPICILMKKKSSSQKVNLDQNLEKWPFKDENLDNGTKTKLTARDSPVKEVQVPLLQINPLYDKEHEHLSNGNMYHTNGSLHTFNGHQQNGATHEKSPALNGVNHEGSPALNGVNHEGSPALNGSPANGTPYIVDDRYPNVRYIDL